MTEENASSFQAAVMKEIGQLPVLLLHILTDYSNHPGSLLVIAHVRFQQLEIGRLAAVGNPMIPSNPLYLELE
ncbi:MAG: hypothetical protein LV473_09710 [Nitrospira sp.]|nr:hypothetical protein [Nitrospira sp.]